MAATPVPGLKELDDALGDLSKSAARGVLRRTAIRALAPFLEEVKRLAPVGEGNLRDSYIIGTKLNKAQKRNVREDKSFAEAYAGTNDPAGVAQEFGTVNHPAQPHAIPAWDGTQGEVLNRVKTDLAEEIDKAQQRAAARAARIAAQNARSAGR